ncbi:MAG TPA: putative 2OG-Fe(II) oxygenase [Dokdonella sp.]|uniref:putative 2OG-Fe(II) oxygenase n=1 Tax=Dokdonella sp. TaxID=2291710 RepID=UPI002D7F9EC4|nr:putative 2OG-Fe(II) oxygenase [Dokdonella sp.]HET9031540.1 putative 2OG-Fe(II) oxygenase [Dokdonella sp.]
MEKLSLFSVPVVRTGFPNPDKLNSELRELFLQREAEGTRWRNPAPSMSIQKGLFESHFSLFTWPEPCVQQLHEFCMVKLFDLVGEMNRYSRERLLSLESQTHAWFHITRRGGRFNAHSHPMASWSGVYCVSPGQNDVDQPKSGVLHFQNPHQQAGMFQDPANSNLIEDYSLQGRNFALKAGELVMFPSWLFHEVFPFHGEGERITVAFNCWFRERE